MKISLNPPVDAASGSLNKIVYSKNHFGPYQKKTYQPTGAKTPFQEDFQNFFKAQSSRWSLLQESERIQWNEFAKELTFTNFNSSPYHPTGKNTFVKCNCNLKLIGIFPIDTPGPIFSFNTPYDLNISWNPSGQFLLIDFFAESYTGPGLNAIYITDGLSPGTFYTNCQFRYLKYDAIGSHPSFNNSVEFTNRFGHPFHSSKKYFVKFICINAQNGLASPPVKSSIILP